MKLRPGFKKKMLEAMIATSATEAAFPTNELPDNPLLEYRTGLPAEANLLGRQGWLLVAVDSSGYNTQLWFCRVLKQ